MSGLFKQSLFIILVSLILAACSEPAELMPRPNVYAPETIADPFCDTPQIYRTNPVPVYYITDRVPIFDPKSKEHIGYSAQRDNRMAYGSAMVRMGGSISWNTLRKISLESKRSKKLTVEIDKFTEHIKGYRIPSATYRAKLTKQSGDPSAYDNGRQKITEDISNEFTRLLQRVKRKEIFLFVHGFNTTFEQGITDWTQIWHYLGRQGVPLIYCWPAAAGGMKGYFVDAESGDSSVAHLKKIIKNLGALPNVDKINIISHSRGTDIACKALLELAIVNTAQGLPAGHGLKVGNLVLLAPDIDYNFMRQRVLEEGVAGIPDRFSVYVSSKDKALALSQWLRSGLQRVGMVDVNKLSKEQLASVTSYPKANIITSNAEPQSWSNHMYYTESPSVSSDLVLLLRYNFSPGEANGRPLKKVSNQVWQLDEGYPFKGYKLPVAANQR